MAKRTQIPTEIARQVLIESGHRCAVCGEPIPLERAHIVPCSESSGHEAENLVCLCANCHARAERDRWEQKVLREYKMRPWVKGGMGCDSVEIMPTERDVAEAPLVPAPPGAGPRTAGLHPGAAWTSDDFDAPLPEEFWTGAS